MKIGDKVKFLFDTGGGRIAAIKGNICYVEDEDGFQIPTPITDVVVEASAESYSTTSMVKAMQKAERQQNIDTDGRSMRAVLNDGVDQPDDETIDDDPSTKEITFKRPVEERKGGNHLCAYLAFVPVDIKQVSNTEFETYLVNDSNYFLQYQYLSAENNSWTVRSAGVLEPNTKEFIEEFTQRDVNDLAHVCIQMIAFKRDKPFLLKQPISTQLRIDQVKFYKLHTFQPNDFFEQPALLYTIVEHDEAPESPLTTSPGEGEITNALLSGEAQSAKVIKKSLPHGGTGGGTVSGVPGSGPLVIDLHIEQLIDSTAGMSSFDILNYQLDKFRNVMAEYRKQRGKKIIFIHGKGDGVLRKALIHDLNYRYRPCTYQDASFQEYGYGATQVTIK